MFKKYLLAISLLALSSGTTLAANPIAKLKVTGRIKPPTCTINNEEQEATIIYNFDITLGLFPEKGDLKLAGQSKNIVISCDSSTYLAFVATDNRLGTQSQESEAFFGLGHYQFKNKDDGKNAETKVGYYTINISNATVKKEDGSKFEKAYIKSNNATTSVPNTLIHKQSEYGWALPGKTSVAGKSFAADFEVKPVINSQMKKIEGEAELDGLATLTFQFGI